LSLWWLPVWMERLLGLWRLRRLLPVLGPLPLVLGRSAFRQKCARRFRDMRACKP
jgi:hypothetical protein